MIMICWHASNKQHPSIASSSLSPQQVIPVEDWLTNFEHIIKLKFGSTKVILVDQNNFGQPFFSNVLSEG